MALLCEDMDYDRDQRARTTSAYLVTLTESDLKSLFQTLGLFQTTIDGYRGGTVDELRINFIRDWMNEKDDVKKCGGATWSSLVKSLRDERVRHTGIADQIEAEKMRGGQEKQAVSPTVSEAVAIARENQQQIKKEFVNLQMLVCEKLQTMQINMSKFLFFIKITFPGFIPASEKIDDIFVAITCNGLWDFINYSPLQQIAEKFARHDEEINAAIHKYQCALAGYLAGTKLAVHIASKSHIPEEAYKPSCATMDQSHFVRLTFKLKAKVTEESLDYLIKLWDKVSAYLGLPSLFYFLDEIHEGCVSATWLVSHGIMLAIDLKIDDPETAKFFSKLGIIRMEVDDLCLYEEQEQSVETATEQKMEQGSSLEQFSDSQEKVEQEASQGIAKETAEQEQDSSSEELPQQEQGGMSVSELMEDLAEVMDWHSLGTHLGLKSRQLDVIEQEIPTGVDAIQRRKGRVLDTWMKGKTGDPSWRDIVSALTKMGEHSIAEEMMRKHGGNVSVNPTVSEAVQITRENQQQIKGEFNKLQMLVCKKLQTMQINTQKFLYFIRGLFQCADFIPPSKTIDDIFEAITRNGLWDFINYSPLQQIAKAFAKNDEEVNAAIHKYRCALNGYLAGTKLADHIASMSPISEEALEDETPRARSDKRYFNKLSIKLEPKVSEESLDYLIELWGNLSEYLCPPSLTYLLDEIHKDCVSFVFLIPPSAMPAIALKIDDPETAKFFSKLGIIRMEVDDLCLYEKQEQSVETATEQESSLKQFPDSLEQVEKEASQGTAKETAEQEQDSSSEELPQQEQGGWQSKALVTGQLQGGEIAKSREQLEHELTLAREEILLLREQLQQKTVPGEPLVKAHEMEASEGATVTESAGGIEGRPNLVELVCFLGKSKTINIAEEIGSKYHIVGTTLLNDHDGTIVPAIEIECLRDPQRINVEILRRWIQGRGMEDCSWQGLISVLRESGLHALADDIEEVKGQ